MTELQPAFLFTVLAIQKLFGLLIDLKDVNYYFNQL